MNTFMDKVKEQRACMIKISYAPLLTLLDLLKPKAIRHEGVQSELLLQVLSNVKKDGFTSNPTILSNPSRANNFTNIYDDDLVEPKNPNSYQFVDTIVTHDVLHKLAKPDIEKVIKRMSNFCDSSIHQVRLPHPLEKETLTWPSLEYWLNLKPTHYVKFNNDNELAIILKH